MAAFILADYEFIGDSRPFTGFAFFLILQKHRYYEKGSFFTGGADNDAHPTRHSTESDYRRSHL